MQRFILPCIFVLTALMACGGASEERTLARFSRITTADGLNDDHVLHILPLTDGRMVFTGDSCINIYSDGAIQQFRVTPHEVFRIPGYTGAYHVYADGEQRLWVKDWGRVWCMDLTSGEYVDLERQPMYDVFVDSRHECWMIREPYKPDSLLQDLDADSAAVYLFYANGSVVCRDRNYGQVRYVSAAYDSTEAKFYDKTSLVVRSQNADGLFYQLRCGTRRYVFLCLNPQTGEWRTVFETTKGLFHSLCISPDGRLALLGCPQGLWEIDLESGRMDLHTEFLTTDNDTLRTGINGIVYDADGELWLATYADGVLHAPQLHTSRSHLIYYVAAALTLIALVTLLVFGLYAARMHRRERRLMQRLRTLIQASQQPDTASPPKAPLSPKASSPSAEDSFIAKAAELVEQNLSTPGYNVEQLAADLCMERTGLYRKLTAVLDQSPTLFIRTIRLQRAATMLKTTDLSIVEISERCGFASPSYFSRLFQQTYGQKPSDYR